jgi:hypothetical protein
VLLVFSFNSFVASFGNTVEFLPKHKFFPAHKIFSLNFGVNLVTKPLLNERKS